MRRAFVEQLILEMKSDPSIVFLTADLGYNALEPLEKAFPAHFLNVGISEQHMVGMAAGLALEGRKVICYSIASFVTMRAFEQIRDDLCYHDLDVKIVGTGGGYNYPSHGVTHHTVEDYAIMRVLPGMRVLAPAYGWEAREATKTILRTRGLFYMRLGRDPQVHFERPGFSFALGKGYVIKEGQDIVLITTGNVLSVGMKAAEILEKNNSVCVISMPSIKPIDKKLIERAAENAKGIFTIEEHSTTGGLADAVGEVLWGCNFPKERFHAFGLPEEKFLKDVGDIDHMLKVAGIEAGEIAKRVASAITR
jgi:transketolase